MSLQALDQPLVPDVYPLEYTAEEHEAFAAQSAAAVPMSPTAKKAWRLQQRRFGLVSVKYNWRWHYSQMRPGYGYHYAPSHECRADCSYGVSRTFYSAGVWSHHPIADPLGGHYSGIGNTETAWAFLRAHHAPRGKYLKGDVALYLQGPWEHHHIVTCIHEGNEYNSWWWSMGQESDPREVRLLYRGDLTGVYRHPALR